MVLTCAGSAVPVKTNRVWQTFSQSEAAPEGVHFYACVQAHPRPHY